jgi:hypothetical protein
MICHFAATSTDPHLWEALQGLPGALTVLCLPLRSNAGWLICAAGACESQGEWSQRCEDAINQARQLLDDVSWMVRDLDLEGV